MSVRDEMRLAVFAVAPAVISMLGFLIRDYSMAILGALVAGVNLMLALWFAARKIEVLETARGSR